MVQGLHLFFITPSSSSWWLHSAPLCSTLLYSAPLCSTLLRSAPLCSALLHSAPLCSTLLHEAPLCSTPLAAQVGGDQSSKKRWDSEWRMRMMMMMMMMTMMMMMMMMMMIMMMTMWFLLDAAVLVHEASASGWQQANGVQGVGSSTFDQTFC
ncbi:hypothetical protein EYF80_066933 [Liparis tanakae]|uniref:Uncharacterized protein n=1 Tax=Liparis tanakae TaxID=230148 RepID=A0A4Z2E2I9_9TELE|nr:hypothetical protein EYF80_066933 [Liparis tanakae]